MPYTTSGGKQAGEAGKKTKFPETEWAKKVEQEIGNLTKKSKGG